MISIISQNKKQTQSLTPCKGGTLTHGGFQASSVRCFHKLPAHFIQIRRTQEAFTTALTSKSDEITIRINAGLLRY